MFSVCLYSMTHSEKQVAKFVGMLAIQFNYLKEDVAIVDSVRNLRNHDADPAVMMYNCWLSLRELTGDSFAAVSSSGGAKSVERRHVTPVEANVPVPRSTATVL